MKKQIAIISLLVTFCCMNSLFAEDKKVDPDLKAALESLDREFDSCFKWWGQIYDPQSGGFFYSLSAKKNPTKYPPNIEPTSKGVSVLKWTGILKETSPEFKKGIITYFQKRQDPQTGFFKDPEYSKYYTPNTLNRAIGMAKGSIEKCGGKVLNPTPLERMNESKDAKAYYAFLESPEALRKWLNELPWETKVWTAGARIRALSGVFKSLPEPKRGILLKEMQDFLKTKQQENGLFGSQKDHWYSKLSGSYKVVGFLELNGLSIPKPKVMAKTILDMFENEKYDNVIVLYNTVNILYILDKNANVLTPVMKVEIINRTARLFKTLHGPDGGFVTLRGRPRPTPNNFPMGANVVESNTNATGLAHKTRSLLIQMATGKESPHPHKRQNDFLDKLPQAKKKSKK